MHWEASHDGRAASLDRIRATYLRQEQKPNWQLPAAHHCLENVRLLRKLYACLVGTTKVVKNTYAAVGTYRCSAPRMADIPMGLCRISSAPASSAAVV